MLLRLLRGRSWWPGRGRGRSADQHASARVGEVRAETGASQAGASRARRPAAPRGSHRKTQASGGAGWPGSNRRSDRSAAPRGPQSPVTAAKAGGGTPPANSGRTPTRAGAHRASATSANSPSRSGASASSARASNTAPPSAVPGSAGARAAIRVAPDAASSAPAAGSASPARTTAAARNSANVSDGQPWYATARSSRADLGLRDCGCLEQVLIREWDADAVPAPETVAAINRLAGLPQLIKEKLAAGLDAIHVGVGGVPDLDHMGELKGLLLPSGRATWDACAGAYGDRKIIVGSRSSPTPDVMCHEVGHALDDIDGGAGRWQSDLADFAALYERCVPHLANDFHRREDELSHREFFADAFAAIASAQRPALVEMLSGDTRSALDVMLYFNVRYGI
jgi:hypothetical protein